MQAAITLSGLTLLPQHKAHTGWETLIINGQVGANVTFNCSGWDVWTGSRSNVKYLCQSPCKKDQHIIIKAESGKTSHKDRIHLDNKGKNLFVTITDLQMSDSKKFLCGLERYGPDSFIEVDLKVKHGKSVFSLFILTKYHRGGYSRQT
uniref:Immunoglobulin V-set domain-containing protein n=1 Tax=Seriola lalandi dorsalis TaxID=1841481 RepID=A0A3B4WIP8_SERLL